MNEKFVSIYRHSPIFMQNIAFSLGYLGLYRERYLSPFYSKYRKFLLKTQWYSAKELEELQNKNLRALVKHAYETTPYYHKKFRSLNLKPEDIKTKKDLKKLPIINKMEVRNNFEDFISNKFYSWQLLHKTTGGSTGLNLNLVWSKKSLMMEHCFSDRLMTWANVGLKPKIAHLGASAILFYANQEKPPYWRKCIPGKMVYFSPYHLSKKYYPYYIKKLRSFRPDVFRGHPTKIQLVARYILDQGIDDIRLKAIFPSSEVLLPNHRKVMEEAFGCKAYDYYGNNEHVSSITECEKGNYHINSEYGIIEFLKDGEDGAYGETCDMVCTGFINYAMPLIRYEIGDYAAPLDEKCSCGRNLPLVKSIIGRNTEAIITKDGRHLMTESIIMGIDVKKSIIEWQVVQKSKEHYILNVTVDKKYPHEEDIADLIKEMKTRVGDVKIEANVVERLKRPANKFSTIVSEINK